MKKLSTFAKAYLIYLLVILIALVSVFFYVRGVMIEYENAAADSWILSEVKDAAKGKGSIYKYLDDKCFGKNTAETGDPNARKERFEKLAAGELSVKLNPYSYDSTKPVYDVLSGEEPFLSVCVEEGETRTKLGILTMSDWNLQYSVLRSGQEGFRPAAGSSYSCSISIPEGFSLLIDGKEYTKEPAREEAIDEFRFIEPYTAVPGYKVYEFTDLGFEPCFSVKNNGGEEVALTADKKNNYKADAAFTATEEAEKRITSIMDPLEMAQLWSKFMTDDVGGSYHGFDTVVSGCRLLKDTALYNQARSWSRGTDVQFVSLHTLKGFSNSRVGNYVKYNDNLYSCDVYTEKDLRLNTGANRTDVFDNRMFFAKINGSWHLIDMFSLAGK